MGKTAVLEAMFLHAGRHNSDLPARIEAMRGHGVFPLHPKGIWGWLFRDRRMAEPIELIGVYDDGREVPVTIRLAETRESIGADSDVISSLSTSDFSQGPADLVLEYPGEDGRLRAARARIEKKGHGGALQPRRRRRRNSRHR